MGIKTPALSIGLMWKATEIVEMTQPWKKKIFQEVRPSGLPLLLQQHHHYLSLVFKCLTMKRRIGMNLGNWNWWVETSKDLTCFPLALGAGIPKGSLETGSEESSSGRSLELWLDQGWVWRIWSWDGKLTSQQVLHKPPRQSNPPNCLSHADLDLTTLLSFFKGSKSINFLKRKKKYSNLIKAHVTPT